MSKVEVLISAMHQSDFSIMERTNVHTDALLINQCDQNSLVEEARSYGRLRCISTTERGLSRSRNMALKNAKGSYCLICDDDEILYSGYEKEIEKAYEAYPDADLICFQIKREGKKYADKPCRIRYLKSLRIGSCQITMKPDSILRKNISFDANFGSGTPVGSGEENIFLFDCLKNKLKIYYVPVCIGEVSQTNSNWFKGFTEEYFFNRGIIINRMMGKGMGSLYALYFAISKYKRYKNNLSFANAVSKLFQGMRKNGI